MTRLIISITILFFVAFFLFASFLVYRFNQPASHFEGKISFEIKPGQGFREIAKDLEREGLISSARYFELYLLLKGSAAKLKPGIYQISPKEPLKEIAFKLYKGPILKEVKITIPEGFNIYQIDTLLAEKKVIKKGQLIKFQPSPYLINRYPFLAQKPREANLEGFLFPDTYRFFVRTDGDIESVVEKFLNNFNRDLNNELKEKIEKKGKNLYQVLILSSLIEKEVPKKEDRLIVSDILQRRLKKGIPLQVDASIVYAKMLKEGISWQKAASLKPSDYKINSLYNTYLYKDLPPSPICNPGLDSIKAVIFPEKNNYWYYLSEPKTGKTYFSKTFLEHKRKKMRYLR